MYECRLNGRWEFQAAEADEWLPATVPGGVYSDLRAAGVIDDPFYEDNELDVQWVGRTDWEYRRTFEIDESVLEHDRVLLQCDGIDTIATILVNDTFVGDSFNMHVGNEFDVADALEPGENEIQVSFRSPVEYATQQAEQTAYDVPYIRYPVDQPGRPFVRKAQCHFGWDWGPCLPTAGLYRDVSILAYSHPRIRYTKTEQDHSFEGDEVELTARIGVDVPAAGDYELSMEIAGADVSETVEIDAGEQELELSVVVDDPDLWWPAGYGTQPLYDLEVTIGDGTNRHVETDSIGFRDVDVVTSRGEANERFVDDDAGDDAAPFYLRVNGTPIFAKGANTIPVAPLYADVTPARYEHLVRSAADANMNVVRVWGGGYYEDDVFYDLCDEYGLLVWQDFMFSCALYPANPEFLDTVEEEVRYQIRRLANHPSIALWCANNENEEALHNWYADHEAHEAHVEDYRKLYDQTISSAVWDEDPSRTYWPGSPSSGQEQDDPYDPDRGDIHYWDVWHEGKPFEAYLTSNPRFVSEFGYQSFPSKDSLRTVLEPEDLNPTAPLMEHHQRNPGGNATILRRLADYFRIPFDVEDFLYVSQLLQGLAMKTAIEHWRRQKPRTMGTIYWQLNDLWPVASWSSVEYDGKWKAQQYMARRQYAPVALSFAPSFGGDDGAANAQADDAEAPEFGEVDALALWITSDEPHPLDGRVDLTVRTLADDEEVLSETIDISTPAQGNEELAVVERADLPDDVASESVMVHAEYSGPGESYAAVDFFEDFKALALPDVEVTVDVEGSVVRLRSDGAALFVTLDPGTLRGCFSDNVFHLAPGEERAVRFDSYDDLRDGLVEAHLEDEMSVRHLRQTY